MLLYLKFKFGTKMLHTFQIVNYTFEGGKYYAKPMLKKNSEIIDVEWKYFNL